MRRHPGDTDIRFAAATIYLAQGDGARAQTALEQVLREKPSLADAHFALATLLRGRGDSALLADRHYREYLRLAPEGASAEQAQSYLLRSVP